jgi:hypothetical protein
MHGFRPQMGSRGSLWLGASGRAVRVSAAGAAQLAHRLDDLHAPVSSRGGLDQR